MTDRWQEFVTKLESSDPDRVNDVIDDVEEMDVEDRIELCDVCFDELVERYAASDDGYVRQSLSPGSMRENRQQVVRSMRGVSGLDAPWRGHGRPGSEQRAAYR